MANDNETVEQACESICELVIAIHDKEHNEKQEIKNAWHIMQQVKDRIIDAHKREMAAKDAEIAELHNMIEELTDALHPFREWFGNQKLIDRAKEMIGLKEI